MTSQAIKQRLENPKPGDGNLLGLKLTDHV